MSFYVVSFYIQLYIKSLGLANLSIFLKVSRVTGKRGTFIGHSGIDTRLKVEFHNL